MKVNVCVSVAKDGCFECHPQKELYGTSIIGWGYTVDEAKESLLANLDMVEKEYVSKGKHACTVKFRYIYDLMSFFSYFSMLNVAVVARRARIAPDVMALYTNGIKMASERNYARIAACLTDLCMDLKGSGF